MLSISLDWLSFTIKDLENGRDLLRNFATNQDWVSIAPLHSYSIGHRSKEGVVRFSNPQRPEMGVHIEFSGSALRTYRANGGDVEALVVELVAARAKATRIDLAKDAQGEAIGLVGIMDSALKGDFTGTVRDISERKAIDGGHTIYIGSYKSDRFSRIYDKAVEQGVVGDWKRYEIVCKADYAKRLLRVLAQHVGCWDSVFHSMARQMFNVSTGNYQKFLNEQSEIGLPQMEKMTDREKWISEQVTHALIEHLHEKPESKAVAALFHALLDFYTQGNGSSQ